MKGNSVGILQFGPTGCPLIFEYIQVMGPLLCFHFYYVCPFTCMIFLYKFYCKTAGKRQQPGV